MNVFITHPLNVSYSSSQYETEVLHGVLGEVAWIQSYPSAFVLHKVATIMTQAHVFSLDCLRFYHCTKVLDNGYLYTCTYVHIYMHVDVCACTYIYICMHSHFQSYLRVFRHCNIWNFIINETNWCRECVEKTKFSNR